MTATVLVVEDELKIRELVRRYLEREALSVLTTGSGAEALTMLETGQNPNVLARERNAAEVTLKQAMLAYREHLVERTQRPAKPETLKVYDRVMRRHVEWKWADRKVREIDSTEIKNKFLETSKVTPTPAQTCNRTFRYLIPLARLRCHLTSLHYPIKLRLSPLMPR